MMDNRVEVGEVAVSMLSDRGALASVWPLRDVFPAVPEEQWEPHRRRHPRCFPTPAEWSSGMNVALVRTPRRVILVDAGDGPPTAGAPPRERGQLLTALRAQGLQPDDVDLVVLTHLHPDHIGWTTTNGAPTFPRARYLLHEAEWNFIQRPDVRADYAAHDFDVAGAISPLAERGVLDLVSGEAKVIDEMMAVPTPGHTGGHVSLLISSQGQRLLLLADALHHPAQATEPEWGTIWDADPATAAASREMALEWAEREGMLTAAYHFPRPGVGRIARDGDERVWRAL